MVLPAFILAIVGPISIAILTAWYGRNVLPPECDMANAENRDFHKFYGLEGQRNHFIITTADACDADIVIRSVLPPAILRSDRSASSFMLMGTFGVGKTMVRCEYARSLPSTGHLSVLILNKELNDYLERFVGRTAAAGVNCASTDCLIGWSKDEFAHVLLSMLVTRFVDQFEQNNMKLSAMATEEKIELITVMCYYYSGFGVSKLEKMVNFLLSKNGVATYTAKKAVTQVEEHGKRQDKMLLKHFKADLKKFAVLRDDPEKLHLLLAIVEGEEYIDEAMSKTVNGKVFRDLTHFTTFIKSHLHKTAVFIIDGIDENRYFFRDHVVNKASLKLFYLSSVSQEIQTSVMAQNFHLSLFYPKIDGIDIQGAIIRPDKFPTYSITWNPQSLINYADQLFTKMNKTASPNRCKPLTSFQSLVNYEEPKIAVTVDQIATPRELHYFLIELVPVLNNHAVGSKPPFVATYDNVKQAFGAAKKHFDKLRS